MNVLFLGANQALGKLMRSHLYCSLDLDKNLILNCVWIAARVFALNFVSFCCLLRFFNGN